MSVWCDWVEYHVKCLGQHSKSEHCAPCPIQTPSRYDWTMVESDVKSNKQKQTISNDSVSEQWRVRTDCAVAQVDMSLHCSLMARQYFLVRLILWSYFYISHDMYKCEDTLSVETTVKQCLSPFWTYVSKEWLSKAMNALTKLNIAEMSSFLGHMLVLAN